MSDVEAGNPFRLGLRSLRLLSRGSRDSTRAAYRAYRAGLDARRIDVPGASPAAPAPRDFAAVVLPMLRAQVRYAARLPFWAERFRQAGIDPTSEFGLDEYRALPVLEREEIASAGDALLHPSVAPAQRRKMATGGSSGKPTVVWTGPIERGWSESGIEHFEHAVGVRPGDRRALLWGHNLDPVARAGLRDRLEDWIENRRWFDCFRLSDETLLAYHAELEEFKPRVMVAYASALAALAETLDRAAVAPPNYPTLGFITGAEKLYDDQRALIERVFRRPVYERYGGRDLGLIGAQIPASGRAYAVDWHNVLVELTEPGDEGALAVTKLHADAMPLFRYRTGDIARVSSRPRGGVITVVDEIVGRELQRIWMPDGRWMHGTVVPHLMKDFDVRDYQLRQRADYSVELLVVAREGFDASREAEVIAALRHSLPTLSLTVSRVAAVERTAAAKWLPVVSEVKGPMVSHGSAPRSNGEPQRSGAHERSS